MTLPSSYSDLLYCPEGEKQEDWALDIASKAFITGERFYVEKLTSETKKVLRDCGFSINCGASMSGIILMRDPESKSPFDRFKKVNKDPEHIYYDIIEYNEPK